MFYSTKTTPNPTFITGTGFIKCIPTTLSSLPLAALAIRVILIDEVLDARIACGGVTWDNFLNRSEVLVFGFVFFLCFDWIFKSVIEKQKEFKKIWQRYYFSLTASTTKSTEWKSWISWVVFFKNQKPNKNKLTYVHTYVQKKISIQPTWIRETEATFSSGVIWPFTTAFWSNLSMRLMK